jgi:hypothetical protein
LGLLRELQNVGERYLLLGEIRADLLDVTEYTAADIRSLSNFTVSDTSAYADPRDYYSIINNCNYIISRTAGDDSPLKTENTAAHAIRAWTYMQVAFNWGKAVYITEPLLSVEDTQKEFPELTIAELTDALITDLEPFVDPIYPDYGQVYSFSSNFLFFPIEVLLGDLYLWRGRSTDDYEKAATYYAEYIDSRTTDGNNQGMPAIRWSRDNFDLQIFGYAYSDRWSPVTVATSSNPELITAIQMATSGSDGKVSQIRQENESFAASEVIDALWDDQSYMLHYVPSTGTATDYYTTGDLRKQGNIIEDGIFFSDGTQMDLVYKTFSTNHLLIYRTGLIYLRYAEAVNRAGKPHTAFAVLKYGLGPLTFSDETKIPQEELADAKPYITVFNDRKYESTEGTGIHARGCGDADFNPNYAIASESETLAAKEDTIRRVEDLICQELALETSFEGNRFQDLMRMAMRRNDPAFLATRVAAKHPEDQSRIYNLLSDTKNWFLPIKK